LPRARVSLLILHHTNASVGPRRFDSLYRHQTRKRVYDQTRACEQRKRACTRLLVLFSMQWCMVCALCADYRMHPIINMHLTGFAAILCPKMDNSIWNKKQSSFEIFKSRLLWFMHACFVLHMSFPLFHELETLQSDSSSRLYVITQYAHGQYV